MPDILSIKKSIYAITQDLKIIEKCKASAVNDGSEDYWLLVLERVQLQFPPSTGKPKKKRKSGVKLTPEQYRRYNEAKLQYEKEMFPAWVNDGHYIEADEPDVGTANGLQAFIVNFLDWSGGYGNRINTMGRKIGDKWIKGTTKKGTGDVSGIINGRAVTFEVKIKRDTPSDDQLKQQKRIRRAGGEYFFVHTVEEFFVLYDGLFVT